MSFFPSGRVISSQEAVMALLLGGGDDDDDDYDDEPALPFTKANHTPDDVAFLKRVFDWGAYARDPCGDGDQVPLGHLSPDDLVRAATLVADDVNALTAANAVGDVSGWPRIFASATMLGADALEDALDSIWRCSRRRRARTTRQGWGTGCGPRSRGL